jgi:predicted transcriptional regulator
MQPEIEKYVQHLFGNIHSISNVIIKRNKNSYYFNVHHFKEYFQKLLV